MFFKYKSGGTGTWSSCKFNTLGNSSIGFAPILDFVETADGSETWLLNAITNVGPTTIAIAIVDSFFSYSSGVYYDADCFETSVKFGGYHAVVVVGYGSDPTDGDYWIVRNSWSSGWGELGYVKMARNRNNLCGIASYALYPKI